MTDPGPARSPDGVRKGSPSPLTPEGALGRAGATQILLFDGLCGFCNRAVQFILRRDPGGTLMFAPLQGPTATAILDRNPALREIDSLVLWEKTGDEETTSVRSEAVIRVGRYLGGFWRTAVLLRVLPRPIRDWAYAVFARNRYRFFDQYEACPIPPPEAQERFLP